MKCEHGVEGCIRSDFHGHLEPTPEDRERVEALILAHPPGLLPKEAIAVLLATVRAEERVAVYREPEDALLHNAYITGKREGREEERMEVVKLLGAQPDAFDASGKRVSGAIDRALAMSVILKKGGSE